MANNNNDNEDIFILRTYTRGNDVQVGKIDDHWDLYATAKNGTKNPLSHRYGWSEHNCSCKKSKTGLVLYPFDTKFKNIVLLVCQDCYGYKAGNESQHKQLCNWYYKIYADSKSFAVISGFAQMADGSFKYNSSTYNEELKYGDGNRCMNQLEQKIVQQVVTNQHHTYNVVKALSQDPALFKCSEGHELKIYEHKDRKVDQDKQYPNEGFLCDICKIPYSNGVSWHCSLHSNGYDKCRMCVSSK